MKGKETSATDSSLVSHPPTATPIPIPIPVALSSLVRSLEVLPDISSEEIVSILFVVRLGDSLHRAFYGTSSNLALVSQLCETLEIQDLTVELEVFKTHWYFRRAGMSSMRRIAWDYDMYSVSVLRRIGQGVLKDRLTPTEGLHLIRKHETKSDYSRIECWYRSFPARMFVIPIMAASCAAVFFNGTWLDFGFAALCGLAAGIVACIGTLHEQILLVTDYLAAIAASMIAVAVAVAYPDSTCFSAQIIGTLYWFLYGTAFVLSLYEIMSNQLTVGVTRYFFAIIKSYGLAFGSMLGVWIASYAGGERLDIVLSQECGNQQHQISDVWSVLLFPMAAIACLMQFRATLKDWPVCLVIQAVAYGSQYYIGTTLNYPELLSNLIPAFLATIASHVCVVILPCFRQRNLSVYLDMEKKELDVSATGSNHENDTVRCFQDEDEDERRLLVSELPAPVTPDSSSIDHDEEDGRCKDLVAYVDTGWAGKGSERSASSPDGSQDRWTRKDATGYIQDTEEDKLASSRSDTWFCLLPALYLLVPGSKLLQQALLSLLASFKSEDDETDWSGLASSWLEIGLSQAIGLRLGFAFLWICTELKIFVCSRWCTEKEQATSLENRDIQ